MAFHGCVQYLVDVSTVGKRFLDTFVETKRVVSLIATRLMAPLGLGRAQLALLRELGRSAPVTQCALAQATTLDPSATARSLAMLSKRGWVRRRRGELDRRESYVELTADGRRLSARVEAHYAAIAELLGGPLNERDVADLARICAKLAPLVEQRASEPRKPRRVTRSGAAPRSRGPRRRARPPARAGVRRRSRRHRELRSHRA